MKDFFTKRVPFVVPNISVFTTLILVISLHTWETVLGFGIAAGLWAWTLHSEYKRWLEDFE